MSRQHKRQQKITKLTRYVIKIDDNQAYVFTFQPGKLFNQVKREMRKVAKALGYTPYELFTGLEFYELLTKPEVKRYMQEVRDLEKAEEKRSSSCSETDSCSTES
ncbi:hypothetical protein VPH526E571_0034 [Vibrio phage 526E57-1]